MSTPNLPPLANPSVALPPTAGVWTSQNVNLDRLADSLAIPLEQVGAQDLKSIPDVWAQLQVFAAALGSESHPLREEAVRDWRALLALFALAEVHDKAYRLELRPVDLAGPDPRGTNGSSRLWRQVLLRLLPGASLPQVDDGGKGPHGRAEWTRPVLIYVRPQQGGSPEEPLFGEAQLVGVLNPATLVASGKVSGQARIASAPWMAHGLADPAALDAFTALTRRDYLVLVRYLETLRSRLGQVSGGGGAGSPGLYPALIKLISEYIEDCRARTAGYDREPKLRPVQVDSDLAPLHRALLTTFAPDLNDYPSGYSECRIAFRPDFSVDGRAPFSGLILLDAGVAESLGRRTQDVHLWRQYSVKEALDSPGVLAQIRREATEAGFVLVTPEDFFTSEFVRLGANGVVEGHPPESPFRSAVLPLSPLALLIFRPEDLLKAVTVTNAPDGSQTVSLALPLNGGQDEHRTVRTFRPDAASGVPNLARNVTWQLGLISTWPDFQHESWRWNFLKILFNPETTSIHPRFGFSARHMARALSGEVNRGLLLERFNLWNRSDSNRLEASAPEFMGKVTPETPGMAAPAFQRLRYLEAEDLVEELQISSSPFEAVFLARRRRPGEASRPVGMVLLARQAPANLAQSAPVVAVDFGTTNTVACHDDRSPVVFRNRVRFPIFDPQGDADNRRIIKWSFVDFLPLFENTTPIPTVAKHRAVGAGGDPGLQRVIQGEDDRPFFSDFIYFQPPSADLQMNQLQEDTREFSGNEQHLRYNLKWADDPAMRTVARRFLRQFILMTGAELLAAGRDPRGAKWRFSYPEAMSPSERGELAENLRRAWAEVFSRVEDGVAEPPAFAHPVEPLISEGAAAAKYFLHDAGEAGAFAGKLTVVLDIGGGTTDIAILKSRRLLWRGSIRLAGGDFLTHYLMNHPEFFVALGLRDVAELLSGFTAEKSSLYAGAGAGSRLRSLGELLFSTSRFGQMMELNFSTISGSDVGRGLRTSAWVFLAGVAYYVGLVVRALGEEIADEELSQATFALGGRGATLFRRYAGAPGDTHAPLNQLLASFIAAAGREPAEYPNRTVLFSPQAKLEVALGMIGDTAQLSALSEKPAFTVRPMGEEIRFGDGTSRRSLEAAEELGAVEDVAYPELIEFERFLKGLTAATGVKVDMLKSQHLSAHAFVRDKVYHGLRDQARARADAIASEETAPLIEPPFIAALRALLDRLGRPAAERAQYIKVTEVA